MYIYTAEICIHDMARRAEVNNFAFSFRNVQKLLELAKLEFNLFHSLQQKELKHISR